MLSAYRQDSLQELLTVMQYNMCAYMLTNMLASLFTDWFIDTKHASRYASMSHFRSLMVTDIVHVMPVYITAKHLLDIIS